MENLKVTILLATYNRAHLIEETLESIIAQTYKNWELIIVDDNSTDETNEVIEKFIQKDPRIFYYRKTDEYTKGLSGTRNYGLDLALKQNAQFIQFFDDDDIMHPEKLQCQMTPFQLQPELELTICEYRRFVPGEIFQEEAGNSKINIQSQNLAQDFLFNRVQINSCGPIFRAYLLLEERFDETMGYGEEKDLFLRILFRYRPKYKPIPRILFYYRYHAESITVSLENIKEKIGCNIVIVQKLWRYLKYYRLLSDKLIAFFLRQFLLENHNKEYIEEVHKYIKEENVLNNFNRLKFRIMIKFHALYIKAFYKVLVFNS